MEIFGKRLHELRKEKGLSMNALGKVFDVSEMAIWRYENNEGEPTMERILKIADYFGVTLNYLFGLEEF